MRGASWGRMVAGVLGLSLWGGASARADVLAFYGGDGFSYGSTDTDPHSFTGELGDGSGLHAGITIGGGNPPPTFFVASHQLGGNIAAARADNDYHSIVLTPNAGMKLNLESISFQLGAQSSDPAFYITNAEMFSSVDGFTTSLAQSIALDNTNDGTPGAMVTSIGGSLSAPAYQGLTGPVEFRIYMADSGAGTLLLDNMTIQGSVVPEPATALLLGSGLVGLAASHRRLRNAR